MANAPFNDPARSQRGEDPAFIAATRRVVALEAEIANLRKGMVHQLTVSGKLLKAVFALDSDYFGGRFQDAKREAADVDPFRDLSVATQVVEAVLEELQGASVFADNPVLRDGIANLVTALESARHAAIEMEKTGINAVGLPVKPETPTTRTFPENNPVGCLAAASGSVHDLVALMGRTRDRFNAMHMMMNEAERARSEAEDAVTPVNVEKIAAALTAELNTVHLELNTSRAQLQATLDSHASTVASLRTKLDQARQQASAEADLRRNEQSEVRSLAAEIARLIGESLSAGESDDLEITLSVLRDALSDEQDLAALVAATEGVVVDWVRLVAARSTTLSRDLAEARSKPAAAAPTPASSPATSAHTAAEVERLRSQLKELTSQLKARDTELASISQQRHLTEAPHQSDAQRDQLEAANRDIAALRAQLLHSTSSLRLREDEARRASESQQQELHQHADATQRLTRQLNGQNERLAVTTSELQAAKTQHAETQRQLAETKAQLAEAIASAKADASRTTASALSARSAAEATAQQEHKRLQGELTLLATQYSQASAALSQASAEKKEAETSSARLASELSSARAALARLEANAKQQASDQTKRAEQVQAEQQQARQALTAAQEALARQQKKAAADEQESQRLVADLARIKADLAKQQGALETITKRETQVSSERDALVRERGGLQRQLETLQVEGKALAQHAAQHQVELDRLRSDAKAEAQRSAAQHEQHVTASKQRQTALEQQLSALQDQATNTMGTHEQASATLRQSIVVHEGRIAALTQESAEGQRQLAQLQSAMQKVTAERDLTRTAAQVNSNERDRLQAQLDRLTLDHQAVSQRLEERESQLTARLTEVSRQHSELKLINAKLASEGERLRGEMATASAASAASASAASGTGKLRRTTVDEVATLERQRDELIKQQDELNRRLGQQGEQEAQVRERLLVAQQRESSLVEEVRRAGEQRERAEQRLESLTSALATQQSELSAAKSAREQQRERFDTLLREAREAVIAAKKRQEQVDGDDRAIIADLLKQIQELRLRTGTGA